MVEWKRLDEVFDLRNGYTPSKSHPENWDGGTIPWFRMEDIRQNGNILTDSIQHITPLGIKKSGLFPANTIIVATTATIGEHALLIADSLANQRFTALIRRKSLMQSVLPRFAYYYCFLLDEWCKQHINVSGFASVNMEGFKQFPFPIPSLSEQNRIVGILDTFTDSIENLKQQIAQRRIQYEFYRDQLLDLEGKEGVEMKTLKELFETRNGYTPSTNNNLFWNDGIIPWFKMEDIRDNGRILSDSNLHITQTAVKGKGLFKANSIILATSATIGEHALITVEHLSNQRFTNLYPKKDYLENINMKFYYYYMFIVDGWCKNHVKQGNFASVDMNGLYNLQIPVPPLSEQNRIVSILDTFEASISNLEAQLAQRQKQYEYYRNKLLSFK